MASPHRSAPLIPPPAPLAMPRQRIRSFRDVLAGAAHSVTSSFAAMLPAPWPRRALAVQPAHRRPTR